MNRKKIAPIFLIIVSLSTLAYTQYLPVVTRSIPTPTETRPMIVVVTSTPEPTDQPIVVVTCTPWRKTPTITLTLEFTYTPTPTPTATLTPTPTNTPTPTTTVTPTPTPTQTPIGGNVEIISVHAEGTPPDQSDEYAEIKNNGSGSINLNDWMLYAGDEGQDFEFPDFDFQSGNTCKVYTNEVHSDSCVNKSFESEQPIWANAGDCGCLYNANDELVSEYCYLEYEGGCPLVAPP